MYDEVQIAVLEKGGYTVQPVHRELGRYNPFIVAFSTKIELLDWLKNNIVNRPPDPTNNDVVKGVRLEMTASDETLV